jgi:hypothetical protein
VTISPLYTSIKICGLSSHESGMVRTHLIVRGSYLMRLMQRVIVDLYSHYKRYTYWSSPG